MDINPYRQNCHVRFGDYWDMGKEKIIVAIKVIVPVIATILWLLLYFTVLWFLPFIWNLNRVKIPKDCKELATEVVWSDIEMVHIKAERVFSSESSREQLEDYIKKNNHHLGRITFGWWSYPEYEHTDAVSPEDYPELWDGGYYVLTYSTWDTSIHMVVYLLGAVSAVLIGIFIFFLFGWLFRGKMDVSMTSLAFGIGCCCNPCITPLGIYSFLYFGPLVAGMLIILLVFGVVFGIMGKKRSDHRIAVAGIICSSLEACLAIGGLLVYFIIAD